MHLSMALAMARTGLASMSHTTTSIMAAFVLALLCLLLR
jgi:hypothetical protein